MPLAISLVLLLTAPAWARDRTVVPALYGVHALPVIENEAPEPIEGARLAIGASLGVRQEEALGALAVLRLGVREVAEVWVEAMLWEAWRTNVRSGGGVGDIWAGFKLLALHEGQWWPALATRTAIKTTTGPDEERRFTDAADVLLDALAAKRFDLGPLRLGVIAKAGAYFFQQGSGAQDDAFDWGLTLSAARGAAALDLEVRGYRGWQVGDEPVLAALRARLPLGPLELEASLARGLNTDAPRWLARVLVAVPVRALRL